MNYLNKKDYITRIADAIEKIQEDGGLSSVEIVPLEVHENGAYEARKGEAYSPVNVDISAYDVTSGEIEITQNSNYLDIAEYQHAKVNVQPKFRTLNVVNNSAHQVWCSSYSFTSDTRNLSCSEKGAYASRSMQITVPSAGHVLLSIRSDTTNYRLSIALSSSSSNALLITAVNTESAVPRQFAFINRFSDGDTITVTSGN